MRPSSRAVLGSPTGSEARRSLSLAVAALAAVAVAVAAAEAALDVAANAEPLWLVIVYAAVGALYVLAGALAWSRRPTNRTGFLLCLGGISVLAAGCETANVAGLTTVGELAAELPIGVVLHLLLAFPRGRLPDRLSRGLVAVGYGATLGLQVPQVIIGIGTPAANVLDDLQSGFGSAAIVVAAVVLVRRRRHAPATGRRTLGLVSGYGVLALLVIVASPRAQTLFGIDPNVRFAVQVLAIAGIPLAFALGVLRGGFARLGEVEELAAWLGAPHDRRTTLRDALRATLGDPSLQLRYWLPDAHAFADTDGRPVPSPVDPARRSDRGAVEVAIAGRRVGAIEYDVRSLETPDVLPGVAGTIALALDHDRLTAELIAQREALLQSRSRLVEAEDRERRRIARDLHDGLQARLVLLALTASRLGPDAHELRVGLEAAVDELRSLAHGLVPALLIERGLYAAAQELVDRVPLRARIDAPAEQHALPPEVETAGYLFLAEGLTNALKHSGATRIDVRLARENGHLAIDIVDDGAGGAAVDGGNGLRGLADRVEALGGRFVLDSPDGRGTRLAAEIPCDH